MATKEIGVVRHVAVAVYDHYSDADEAVKNLEKVGFDMKKLSIIGKDYYTEDRIIGYYNTGERVATWGKVGAFWGGVWGLLFGAAFLLIPGIGPVVIAGPFVATLLGALEGAVVVGGLSALGAGLYSLGIPKDSVLRYETAIKAGKFVLIINGTPDEVAHAKDVIDGTATENAEVHIPAAA